MTTTRSTILRPLNTAISELGFCNGILYLGGRFLQKASFGRCRLIRYYIVAQPVPHPFEPRCRPASGGSVVDLPAEGQLRTVFPRPKYAIEKRYRDGNVCLVAKVKEKFAGFLWFARGYYDEDEVCCRFVLADPLSCVWDFDVHVEPQFRMGRTFARLWDAANERLSREGVYWSLSRISAFNVDSLKAHGRFGLHKIHTLTFVCLGPLQLSLMSCRPFFHLSWSGYPMPKVQLHAPKN